MRLEIPEPLDALFSVEAGSVANFFGAAGTGKTNLCILLSLDCVRKGGKVIYIDTEGGFSAERVKQLAGKNDIINILNSVVLMEPKTFEEQGKAIRGLQKDKFDLIILDSAVALYRLEHSDSSKTELSEHNRELSRQLSVLSAISRDKKIPVVLTAHTYKNWDTAEDEIVGGGPLKYWSKSIIFLEKTGKTSERKATIIKHRSEPEGKSVKFMIVEEGIKPSGFKIF